MTERSPDDDLAEYVRVLRGFGLSDAEILELHGDRSLADGIALQSALSQLTDDDLSPEGLYDRLHATLARSSRGIDATAQFWNRVPGVQLGRVLSPYGYDVEVHLGESSRSPFSVVLHDHDRGTTRQMEFAYPGGPLGEHNYPALVYAVETELLERPDLTFVLLTDEGRRWRFVLVEREALNGLKDEYGGQVEVFGRPILRDHQPADFASGAPESEVGGPATTGNRRVEGPSGDPPGPEVDRDGDDGASDPSAGPAPVVPDWLQEGVVSGGGLEAVIEKLREESGPSTHVGEQSVEDVFEELARPPSETGSRGRRTTGEGIDDVLDQLWSDDDDGSLPELERTAIPDPDDHGTDETGGDVTESAGSIDESAEEGVDEVSDPVERGEEVSEPTEESAEPGESDEEVPEPTDEVSEPAEPDEEVPEPTDESAEPGEPDGEEPEPPDEPAPPTSDGVEDSTATADAGLEGSLDPDSAKTARTPGAPDSTTATPDAPAPDQPSDGPTAGGAGTDSPTADASTSTDQPTTADASTTDDAEPDESEVPTVEGRDDEASDDAGVPDSWAAPPTTDAGGGPKRAVSDRSVDDVFDELERAAQAEQSDPDPVTVRKTSGEEDPWDGVSLDPDLGERVAQRAADDFGDGSGASSGSGGTLVGGGPERVVSEGSVDDVIAAGAGPDAGDDPTDGDESADVAAPETPDVPDSTPGTTGGESTSPPETGDEVQETPDTTPGAAETDPAPSDAPETGPVDDERSPEEMVESDDAPPQPDPQTVEGESADDLFDEFTEGMADTVKSHDDAGIEFESAPSTDPEPESMRFDEAMDWADRQSGTADDAGDADAGDVSADAEVASSTPGGDPETETPTPEVGSTVPGEGEETAGDSGDAPAEGADPAAGRPSPDTVAEARDEAGQTADATPATSGGASDPGDAAANEPDAEPVEDADGDDEPEGEETTPDPGTAFVELAEEGGEDLDEVLDDDLDVDALIDDVAGREAPADGDESRATGAGHDGPAADDVDEVIEDAEGDVPSHAPDAGTDDDEGEPLIREAESGAGSDPDGETEGVGGPAGTGPDAPADPVGDEVVADAESTGGEGGTDDDAPRVVDVAAPETDDGAETASPETATDDESSPADDEPSTIAGRPLDEEEESLIDRIRSLFDRMFR